MIVIFFALSQEIKSLKSRVNTLKKVHFGQAIFYHSEFCGFPLTLVQTGIGKDVSDILRHLSKSFRIQLVVSSGFAGSLRNEISGGDIVIGKRILRSLQEGLSGKIPSYSTCSSDNSMVRTATDIGTTRNFCVHSGDILTTNDIIRSSSVKKRLGDQSAAIAVDMESFIIAEQAHALGLPFITIRAISDGVNDDIKISDRLITEKGNVDIPAVVFYILKKPYRLPELNRLRKQTKAATTALSLFLPDFITKIYNTLLTYNISEEVV